MANTTNLDLVKPAGTDYALVSVINSNSDKIDAFAGSTNTAIAKVHAYEEKTAVGSLDDLKTLLTNELSGMSNNTLKLIKVPTSAAFDVFANGQTYLVEIKKMTGTYSSFLFQIVANTTVIVGSKSSSTWKFEVLALKSDIPQIVTDSITTDANGRFNVSTYIGTNKTLLGITNTGSGWCHFRLYSGSNGTTMCIVTDYDTNTPKPNTTVSLRMVYI